MARGQADFGMYAPKALGGSLSDMADLAVRLGSIVEYDRRGDVIYLDDFTTPKLRCLTSVDGTSSVVLDNDYSVSGGQCVLLTTQAAANKWAIIEHHIAPLVTGKHGSKIAISLYSMLEDTCWLLIQIQIFDGTYGHSPAIRLNPYAYTLEYLDENSAYQVFETDFKAESPHQSDFHNMKLVYDLDTGKYVRFLFDVLSWDLSAYSYRKYSDTRYPRHWVRHYLNPTSAYAFTVRLDNFVYTINEP